MLREQIVDLTLTTREVDGKTVVSVGGEIDVYTAPKLRDQITELVADGSYHIIIDMEGVEFLDSTGLGSAGGRVEEGPGSRRVARAGLHPGPPPEDLPDHRAGQGVRHPRLHGVRTLLLTRVRAAATGCVDSGPFMHPALQEVCVFPGGDT